MRQRKIYEYVKKLAVLMLRCRLDMRSCLGVDRWAHIWCKQIITLYVELLLRNENKLEKNGLFQITNLMYNSFILQQYVCYTTILNMFRAARCSSSGGQISSPQPLVSSPSVNSRTVCRLRADLSPLSTCILYGCLHRVTIPEAVVIQFVLLRMSSVLLETFWGS